MTIHSVPIAYRAMKFNKFATVHANNNLYHDLPFIFPSCYKWNNHRIGKFFIIQKAVCLPHKNRITFSTPEANSNLMRLERQ